MASVRRCRFGRHVIRRFHTSMPRTFGALPRVFSLSARALGLETHCEEGGASAPIRIKPLYFEGIGTLDPEGNAAVKALC